MTRDEFIEYIVVEWDAKEVDDWVYETTADYMGDNLDSVTVRFSVRSSSVYLQRYTVKQSGTGEYWSDYDWEEEIWFKDIVRMKDGMLYVVLDPFS